MSTNWRIVALDTGTSEIEKSILTYLTDCGATIRIPRVMWYIESLGPYPKRIMVDTSAESSEVAEHIIGENLTRTPEQEPIRAMKGIGVRPQDIDYVILTHLHWDHAANNHLFPNAKFLVQRSELRYAYAPNRYFEKAFLSPQGGYTPPYLKTQFDLIQGDVELFSGVQLLHSPGHTPGSQAVRVKTSQGWATVSGDAIFTYENLEKDIPPGFHVNLDAAMDSMHKIAAVSDLVLPSHDYRVFKTNSPQEF